MIGNSGVGGEELAPTKSDRWPTDHAGEGGNKRMAYPSWPLSWLHPVWASTGTLSRRSTGCRDVQSVQLKIEDQLTVALEDIFCVFLTIDVYLFIFFNGVMFWNECVITDVWISSVCFVSLWCHVVKWHVNTSKLFFLKSTQTWNCTRNCWHW